MRALLSKREVAALEGRSERWVDLHADQFQTHQSDKKARNGRAPALIHISSLSPEAQRKWAERQREKVVEIAPPGAAPGQLALALTMPDGPNLTPEDRAEAERRFRVIEPLVAPEQFRAVWLAHGNRKLALVDWLCEQHQVKQRTVYHWLKAWKDGGLPALVRRDRSDKGKPKAFNAAALDFVLAAALPRTGVYGALSVREIHRAYEEERAWRAAHAEVRLGEFELRKYARYVDENRRLRAEAQLPAASYETFRVWFNRIPSVVKVMARDGEEAFSARQEIISFRDLSEIAPLDYLVMDHRRADCFCLVRDKKAGWKLVRPWMTAAIDMRTRKWLAFAIVETPSSDSIATVLKRVFLDHGVPKACYWDNGKDFTCEWLEGRKRARGAAYKVRELDAPVRGVLETLGVRVHHAIVKRARAKLIEPNFASVANWEKTLPEYCGNSPSARPERLEKLIERHEKWVKGEAEETPFRTIEEIAALYDECIETLNEREHTGEGMRKITATGHGWMCPNECWEREIKRVEVRRAAPEVIQFAFHKRRRLTVQNGEVRPTFGGRQFHYRMVQNPIALMALNGREVEFAYDPHDLETAALYLDGRLLGLASNVELRRMGEESFVADERDRRAARREVKKFIAAVHTAVPVASPVERAERRMAVRPAAVSRPERPAQAESLPHGVAMLRAAEAAAYRDDGGDDDEFKFFAEA